MPLTNAEKCKRRREKKAAEKKIEYRRYMFEPQAEDFDSVLRGDSKIVPATKKKDKV